jgi:hypothetical protein
MFLRTLSSALCTGLLAAASFAPYANAQAPVAMAPAKKAPLSPAETASVMLAGKEITIAYGAPSLRGRHVGGPEIVPYGEVWRTGANPATTIVTPVGLMIGKLMVPAGTYTLFTLPTAKEWTLIVSKKTGEWGIPYPEGSDFGRTPMMKKSIGSSQEVMSISFEKTSGNKTEMHVKWETTDVWVPVVVM